MPSIERMFTSDHRAAEGHFPGNPIIPGAVLLSTMLDAIASELRVSLSPCRIKAAKFYSPVRPGDSVVISFTAEDGGTRVVVEHNAKLESADLWATGARKFERSWTLVLAALQAASVPDDR